MQNHHLLKSASIFLGVLEFQDIPGPLGSQNKCYPQMTRVTRKQTLTFSVPGMTPYGVMKQFYMAVAPKGLIKRGFLSEN